MEFWGLVIPLFFFFFRCLRFLRNYVSIIVNISNISNNTVLKYYLLWIFASIRRLFQLVVYIGVSAPPHLKKMIPSFVNCPLKSTNYRSPLFRRFTPPPKYFFFMYPLHLLFKPPKKQRMFQRTPKKLKFFLSLTPSHLLRIIKFLVDISQFKFFFMTEKNIFI